MEYTMPENFEEQVDVLVQDAVRQVIELNRKSEYAVFCEWSGHVDGFRVYIAANKKDRSTDWIADGVAYNLSAKTDPMYVGKALESMQYMVQNLQCLIDGYDIIPQLPNGVLAMTDHDLTKPPKEVSKDE